MAFLTQTTMSDKTAHERVAFSVRLPGEGAGTRGTAGREQEKYRVTYDGQETFVFPCQINISADFIRTTSRQGGRHRRIWIFPEQVFGEGTGHRQSGRCA